MGLPRHSLLPCSIDQVPVLSKTSLHLTGLLSSAGVPGYPPGQRGSLCPSRWAPCIPRGSRRLIVAICDHYRRRGDGIVRNCGFCSYCGEVAVFSIVESCLLRVVLVLEFDCRSLSIPTLVPNGTLSSGIERWSIPSGIRGLLSGIRLMFQPLLITKYFHLNASLLSALRNVGSRFSTSVQSKLS